MHFLSTVSLASSLIALSGAVPTLTGRSTSFCPGQSHLTDEVKCSSGFIGCVAYDKGSEICNGPKRFNNDCSGAAGLGSFYNCANGFKGCTTNPRICDMGSSPGTQEPCAEGSKWYVCASSGFAGCSNDPDVCDSPKPGHKECPEGSSFYVCASNGFRGCSKNPGICDTPKESNCTTSTPTPSATVILVEAPTSSCTTPVPEPPVSTSCSTSTTSTCTSSTTTPIKSTSCETPTTTTTPTITPSQSCSTSTTPSYPVVTDPAEPCKSCDDEHVTDPLETPEPCSCEEEEECDTCDSNNGGHGCTDNCDDGTVVPPPQTDSCGKDQGAWYVCANGFKGCSTDPHVCEPATTVPTVPNVPVVPAHVTPTCPKDTWYVRPNECASGFVGCTGSQLGSITEICGGEKRFWGSCPAKHGNYYNCANGFVGCSTDVGVCDKKKMQ